ANSLQIEASKLGASLPKPTIEVIAGILTQMNCYYSNLIEGHYTHPLDIDRALKKDFSSDVATRALQEESKAHIEVESMMLNRLNVKEATNPCSFEFLSWLHRSFYERLPEEFKLVGFPDKSENHEKIEIEAGNLRERDVKVGRHIPPEAKELGLLMSSFASAYNPKRFSGLEPLLALGASHHRLLWIHPFLDGNGRIARLFSTAFLQHAQIYSQGLWSLSRGLARNNEQYKNVLAQADQQRNGDIDGRGQLSEKQLVNLIHFFLDTCLDQVKFMGDLLDLKGLLNRIETYFAIRNAGGFPNLKPLHSKSAIIVTSILLRGEVTKGELSRYTNMSERSTRDIMKQLLQEGLLVIKGPGRGTLCFGLPLHVVNHYFPALYPESIKPR
ncbi:MAG: Fic family protein, partial [Proteobacteria bacterium]|nr:Fic family protein [Pseudomonadota bacterium]